MMKSPNWLDKEGRAYWRRVAPTLARDGVLTAATADLLACAAQAFSTYREAGDNLKEQGRVITTKSGTVKPNPWLTVEKQAFETLARVAKELKIAEQPGDTQDELDNWLDEDGKT
jgi:P27 family predicted phage terminase small subunit